MGALLASLVVVAAAAPGAETLVIARDTVIEATIEGKPVRLKVDPGAYMSPIINPDAAERLGLKAGMFGVIAKVGPDEVRGRTAVLDFGLPGATGTKKARAVWFERRFVEGADGAIHPLFLTQGRVRILLPGRGGAVSELPLGTTGFKERGSMLVFAGEPVKVTYSLMRAATLASADAGRLIALDRAGKLGGGGTMPIAFDIARPYRDLTLGQPIDIGPFRFPALRVRAPDAGELGIPESDRDPDEIVVQGKTGKKAKREITIARDQLDRCAWLETDRAADVIRFDCPG